MAIASRKGIVLLAAGLLVAAGGLVAIVKQRGERRLDAAMERFETEIGTLDPAVHAPPALVDEDNAAFWLQRGAAALDLSEADRAALNELWEREGDPGPGVEDLLEREPLIFCQLILWVEPESEPATLATAWPSRATGGGEVSSPSRTRPSTRRRISSTSAMNRRCARSGGSLTTSSPFASLSAWSTASDDSPRAVS